MIATPSPIVESPEGTAGIEIETIGEGAGAAADEGVGWAAWTTAVIDADLVWTETDALELESKVESVESTPQSSMVEADSGAKVIDGAAGSIDDVVVEAVG